MITQKLSIANIRHSLQTYFNADLQYLMQLCAYRLLVSTLPYRLSACVSRPVCILFSDRTCRLYVALGVTGLYFCCQTYNSRVTEAQPFSVNSVISRGQAEFGCETETGGN